jgi:hypothetical protein
MTGSIVQGIGEILPRAMKKASFHLRFSIAALRKI